ncbi:reverse transcriptase domain-containing protein, partial [Tanacetum coccineum]
MQSPSGSGSLPSNTVANPIGDVKAITTRSGVSYNVHTIPPTPSLSKEVERETDATKDKHLSLLELTSTRMTLELANRSTVTPAGVAEDVFVKVGKFIFRPTSLLLITWSILGVPLILGRPFLRTARALIDVHGEEMTLRVNDEAITFKVGHTSRYSHNYYDDTVHQVNVIDVACEEYAQEVPGFLPLSLPPSSPARPSPPPATGCHRRKSFPAGFFRQDQKGSSWADLSDPHIHSPPRAIFHHHHSPTDATIIIIIITSPSPPKPPLSPPSPSPRK